MPAPLVDDLATLSELEEGSILSELQKRYNSDLIYTYIGDILIAVNPYKTIRGIYDVEECTKYTGVTVRSSLPPHIYAISDAAYHNMLRNETNQCCVVSGESGAGKTESTKLMIQHIAHLCRHGDNDLHERIVKVNPLMEAFGNAQTVLNNNSSRFGKYIELMFDGKGQIQGAKISEYLLEKSRVVSQSAGERNFHIFYYMLAGIDDARRKANLLKKAEEHRIIRPDGGRSVFVDDAELSHCKDMWKTLMEIMEVVGFSSKDDVHDTVDGILAILAAILHIADIEFVPDEETNGVYIKDDKILVLASQLLAVDYEKLHEALISTVANVGVGGETVTSLKNTMQADDGRDALAKALYGRLFSWIVFKINEKLGKDKEPVTKTTIGILDIYGFENFTYNSFEQLCINITNEQLQCFFNEHIFRWELEEYEREGVSGNDITYVDNKSLLDFFLESKPMGLFTLLDDENKTPQGNDLNFLDKLSKYSPSLSEFKRPKGISPEFMIQHFAGQVTYNVTGFLEKNRDTLSDNMMGCLKKSNAQLVFELFSPISDFGQLVISTNSGTIRKRFTRKSRMFLDLPDLTPNSSSNMLLKRASRMILDSGKSTGPTSKSKPLSRLTPLSETTDMKSAKTLRTLGSQFKNSLIALINRLQSAQPHFVRCIKPNTKKAANSFNTDIVMLQLRYTGVLETVKIRKQGYPTRLGFVEFMQRYRYVAFTPVSGAKPDSSSCRQLLEAVGLKNWQIGHSKVFLKYFHVEQLNVKLCEFERRIATCQKHLRSFVARRKYAKMVAEAKACADLAQSLALSVHNANRLCETCQQNMRESDAEQHRKRLADEQRRLQEELEERQKQEEKQKQEERQKQEEKQKQENQEQPPVDQPAKKVQKRPPIGTIKAPESADRPGLPSFRPPTITEEKPSRCESNCTCAWKSFAEFVKSGSLGIANDLPDTTQTLLNDSLPKFPKHDRHNWAKVYLMEKNAMIGKFYIKDSEVVINDSKTMYTGTVCGLRHENFEHLDDRQVSAALNDVKEGIRLKRESDGSVSMMRLCSKPVTVKECQNGRRHALSKEIIDCKGVLPAKLPVKVLDMARYKSSVVELLSQVKLCDPQIFLQLATFSYAFGKDTPIDTDTPLWMFVVNFDMLRLLGREDIFMGMMSQLKMGNKELESLAIENLHETCALWSKTVKSI